MHQTKVKISLISSNSSPSFSCQSGKQTTGKAASGRVRKKKKKVTTLAGNKQPSSPSSTTTGPSKASSLSSIASSINSVVNSSASYGESELNKSTSSTYSQLPIDNQQQQQQQSQQHSHQQQQLNNNNSLVYCDSLHLSNNNNTTNNNNFTNGQFMNSSTSSSTYYTPSFPLKNQFNSHPSQHSINSNQSLNSNLDNLSNLNNSLNNYLPIKREYGCVKDTKSINKYDRTMMDCKSLINPNQHPFGNSSSNQLNLPANNIATYNGKLPLCCGCNKPILDRFLLQTMDTFWHEDCLKCKICECRLGEVGSSLFTKMEMLLCKRDYLRLFGLNGVCAICKKTIPGFELVMKAKGNNYHIDCFACQFCSHRFCVGDRFYLHDDKILCEYDYDMMTNGQTNNNQLPNNPNDANNLRPSNTPSHISSTQ